ncbi:L-lactate dehydrogenase (quinone) large subunit LdhH [Geomobilimonas luticola]|uniref:LUD domain-containing protein n=1 Tax=Geomobilimonas luticola TaxID=1114878 RepID=A0ABS5SE27_9BACT|nr:LUD domain-containing protein [Geomobilimonas luticola]MBT0652861.1 LUD domain-containing protein [Geomobilimonas luticola]
MDKGLIQQKLDNTFLRKALRNFAAAYPVARAKAFEGIDFEKLRGRISDFKMAGLEQLPALVEQFTASAEKSGARVHLCTTPEDANRTILEIIRSKNADFLVKSKAMTSEEIELNHYLEKNGVRCLETDLGEWIIQLAGERPSHMVMPAIHKNRDEVAELFSRETGKECPPDIPYLVQTAREALRSGFLTGQVGMSGANVAMADSGTLGIITNEGNGRLVTTLPRTHIALVGVEKIVPSLTEALDIIDILPKNATGQKITSYVSFIKGPTGVEGRELHIVLLDNGRLRLAADPAFREALKCVKCGACANVCPIYELVGGHVFGHIYVGGIGLVLTPFFHGFDKAEEILKLCIGCRKCNEVCAAKIDIEGLIVDLRDKIRKPFGQKFLFGTLMKNRKLFHAALRTAYLAQKPFQGEGGRIRHLPLVLNRETANRSLPPIAETPFRDMFQRSSRSLVPGPESREKVLFYSGCLADFVYPDMCRDTVTSLEKLGYTVTFPQEQTCCGIPARYSGEMEVARDMARINTDVLLNEEADFVVTICPTCTMSLKHDFGKLLADDPVYAEKVRRLAAKTFNFSELAARKAGTRDSGSGTSKGERQVVTYHDACHLKRGCGVHEEPRKVLQELAGMEIAEMTDCDKCCGFGGSYSIKYPEISQEVLKNKLENIAATGAQTVAVDCPGCKLQIEGGLEAAGSTLKVEHSATLVARRIG